MMIRWHLVLWLGLSIASLAYNSEESIASYDYDDIDFKFNIDFGDKRAIDTFNYVIDNTWRLLGFDPNSFKEAKVSVRDSSKRIELMLALLMIKKYPLMRTVNEKAIILVKEIKEGNLCDRVELIDVILNNLIKSSKFEELYTVIERLNEREKIIIAKGLQSEMVDDKLIDNCGRVSCDNGQLALSLLMPMLKNTFK